MKERPYYDAVEGWLSKKEGCFKTCQNKGTRLGRIDVVGARHLGGDLATDYELIAVEVKTDESFFASASQAAGYSVFAHRCYLASYERGAKPYTRSQVEVALCLGIGLVKIRSRQDTGIQVFLSAPPRRPPRRFTLQMLESMGLSECVLCRGIFEGTYKEGVERAEDVDEIPELMRRAAESSSSGTPVGMLFWSDRAMLMKAAAGDGKENTARRYVCPDCLTHLLGPLANERVSNSGK